MRCPKCGHVQTGRVECERCRAIFATARMVCQRNKKVAKGAPQQSEFPRIPVALTLLFCVIAAGGLWYFLFWPASGGAATAGDRNGAMQQVKTLKNQIVVSSGRGPVVDETLQSTIPFGSSL
ncbi:MAG: hypothetical protein M0O96_05510 [Desulforhopalus sp.]|nr:hypothetical protein [Desulforhopalus sp.]